ncbi:MAG: GH3 auxin-responsive promoter family protein, partial [Gammaproteobacteria bacterium]|nr:GH3 auxin-responsive promoter family protein [Gammaproteobacteria bacterium]
KPLLYQTEITFADVWPGIRLLATWTAGSCGIALETLRHKLPEQTQILDLGFVSTEFRGTFAIDGRSGAGVPLLNQHFYEFCERENWDAGVAETVTAEKIEPGRDYYLIVTAENGLYRYFMNDIVRVTGTLNGVPLLKFVQKGKGVTNITGEKLYEEQVIQAVKSVEEELTFEPTFFMMLADEFTRQYELLIETAYRNIDKLAHLIDAKLAELNIEYRAKRQSGRLRPLKISALRSGAYEAYKNFCVANGQREGQFKTLLLQFKKDVRFPFDQYLEAGI